MGASISSTVPTFLVHGHSDLLRQFPRQLDRVPTVQPARASLISNRTCGSSSPIYWMPIAWYGGLALVTLMATLYGAARALGLAGPHRVCRRGSANDILGLSQLVMR